VHLLVQFAEKVNIKTKMDNLIVRCVLLDITKIKQDKRVVHHVKQGNIVIRKARIVVKPVLLGNIKANQEKRVV
jgi:hypothetical protein